MKNKKLLLSFLFYLFLITKTTIGSMNEVKSLNDLYFNESSERVDFQIKEVDAFFNLLKLKSTTIDFLKAKNNFLNLALKLKEEQSENTAKNDSMMNKELQDFLASIKDLPQKTDKFWIIQSLIAATAIPIALDAIKNKEHSFLAKNITPSIARNTAISGACGISIALILKNLEKVKNSIKTTEKVLKLSWNNKLVIMKTNTLLIALLCANYLTRGQKSLLAHTIQHGGSEIIPSILDQLIATISYSIKTLKPIK